MSEKTPPPPTVTQDQPIHNPTKWREDFPVDYAKEEHVERREFTKFMLLISGSFVVGQLYIALKRVFKGEVTYPEKKIISLNQLKVGQSIIFSYPEKNDTNLLIRLSENEVLAYSNKCTHLLCPVIPQVEKKLIHCPCHSGYFDLMNGRPVAGPPRRRLPRIKTKIKNNFIYAYGIEV